MRVVGGTALSLVAAVVCVLHHFVKLAENRSATFSWESTPLLLDSILLRAEAPNDRVAELGRVVFRRGPSRQKLGARFFNGHHVALSVCEK